MKNYTKYEITRRSGAFYTYKDLKLGQGRENVKSFLAGNEKVTTALEKEILAHIEKIKAANAEPTKATTAKATTAKATAEEAPAETEKPDKKTPAKTS